MTTIDPTGQLVAIIRQQVAAARGGQVGRNARQSEPSRTKGPKQPGTSLSELLARRVQTIDPDDPGRNRKAFRAFLESVLLGELGMELINDPAFYRLVDDVQGTMESDAILRARIDEAGQLLLNIQTPAGKG